MRLINSEEDMQWLFDVHVKNLHVSWKPRSAIIFGNEDSPERIDLYPRRDPLWTDIPLTGTPLFDGYSFCGPLQRDDAMAIDNEERKREEQL